MVMIMTTTWYPHGKEKQVGEIFVELKDRLPTEHFEEPILSLGICATKDGIKAISIDKIKDGHYEKALRLITKRMLEFSSIKGFKYEIETLMSGSEAMSLIGLGVPAGVAL